MNVNDTYLLEITSSAKGLNKVAKDLDTLKTSLKGFSFPASKVNTFTAFSNSINELGKATSAIDSGKIVAFASAMRQLSDVKIKLPKGLDQSVKDIEKAFTGLGDSKELYKKVNSFKRIMSTLSDLKFGNMKGASTGVENFTKTLDKLDFRKVYEQANALNRILLPLADTMKSIGSASASLGINKSFGKGLGNAINGISETLGDTKSTKKKKTVSTQGVKEEIDDATKKLEKFREAFQKVQEVATKAFAKIKSAIAGVASGLLKIGKVGLNSSLINPFKGLASSISNAVKKLKTLWSSLARIAMYRALRTAIKEIAKAIKEGLNNLYQWSKITGGDFAPAVDKIATSMLYLKNSFGAMVSPLITAVAPAIDLITDKLVAMLNVVNQLFARLTGRATWTEALKYPTEYAEKAGGATKKIKDNIQDFDELHILRTPSSGSGKTADDYSKMFKESEFTEGIWQWVENFKSAIREGRFYEAGSILADEINKLINKIDWKKIGSDLGDKITDTFKFAFGFLKNIDFVKIGTSIADFLNSAIDHIDTNLVGQTFARKWTAIIDFLYGFVTTFDFPAFGWKISEFVQGWFEELDGNRIGTTISEAIKGVLDMAISFMSNDAMWTEFVEDIAGILNNIDWYGIFVRVLTLGTKIISALGTVIKTAITGTSSSSNSLTNSYYSAISSQAGSSSVASRIASEMQNANKDTVGFGQQLTDSIASSIRSADTTSIANAIVELFNEITILLGGVVYELGMTLGVKLAEGISNELIGGHWDEDGNWVSANHIGGYGSAYLANRANQRNTVTTQSGGNNQRTTQTSTSRTSAWSTPKPTGKAYSYNDDAKSASRAGTIITKTYNNIASSATKSFTIQKNGFESLSKAVSDGTSVMTEAVSLFGDKMNGDVVAKITSSKNAISATITSLSEDTKFKMNDMTNSVIGSISNADKAIVTPMANIKNTITNGFKEAGTESIKAINEMGSKMSGALDGAISASKETVSGYKGVWDGLKGSVKDTSNSVIAGSESMANGVTTAFNGIIRNLKNFRVKIPDIGDNKDAGKEFDFTHLKELEKISIPRLAKGGIISSPTTALIGEAGKEAVVPLENNTGWIDNLADRLGGDGEEIALLREEVNLLRTIAGKSFTISSREVFNAVREENADYITMTGKNALVM